MTSKESNKKKTNISTIIIRIAAIILLIVGLVLIFNKQIRNQMVKQNQSKALSSLTVKKVEQNQKRKGCLILIKLKKLILHK